MRLHRALMRAFLALVAIAPAVLLYAAQPGLADSTGYVCDTDVKYYCFYVVYTPNPTFISIEQRWHEGGSGGSALQWQRYQTQDWRHDPTDGSWYFLRGYPQGVWYNPAQPLNHPNGQWDSVIDTHYVSFDAVARMQNRYYSCTTTCYYWCAEYIDFWLNLGSYSRGAGCL